jgi:hypothetical protein
MDEDIPKRLIIFYGMMKSGNHAIIKWVFENALRQFIPEEQIQAMKLGYTEQVKIGNAVAFYNDIIRFPPKSDFMTPCSFTLVSIEEEFAEIPPHILKDTKWESIHKVFIFRDLKNMVASRKFSREYSVQHFGTTKTICKLWKNMLDASKNVLDSIHVSYDELVQNGDSDLIERLGIKPLAHRLRFDQIPRIVSNTHKPGWSSFPGDTNFTKRGEKLNMEDYKIIEPYL